MNDKSNSIKTITVAEGSGFCFGVDRAAKKLEAAIASKHPSERIYTLGALIHNEIFLTYKCDPHIYLIDCLYVEFVQLKCKSE